MQTFQDLKRLGNDEQARAIFALALVNKWRGGVEYRTAMVADEYDREKNRTITQFVRTILAANGQAIKDDFAANNRLTSNFFNRLNTQRTMYSLGNGVTFEDKSVKDRLGKNFDTVLKEAGYHALIHGVSYLFWGFDRAYCFKTTEFAPLWDEETGELRAGVRFWRVAEGKPLYLVLYEEDGYTKYKQEQDQPLEMVDEKRPYLTNVVVSEVGGEQVVGSGNYSRLPVVPLWGSRLHQSTLVGMRSKIDSYDLIRSGFANDLQECAQVYWLINGAGGMNEADLANFRRRLLFRHIASADDAQVVPYTQEVPYQARAEYLASIRKQIYEDFGALDVHTMAAGSTNDHIDAAYQTLDENADDFEYQIIACMERFLQILGIADQVPRFTRNKISNIKEQVETVMLEAAYLDSRTLLEKLPNISADDAEEVLARKAAEDIDRFGGM